MPRFSFTIDDVSAEAMLRIVGDQKRASISRWIANTVRAEILRQIVESKKPSPPGEGSVPPA